MTKVVDMCFFAESALAETHRREVILYALHHGKLPAVTHINFFRNPYKMTSSRCLSARADSAKKHMSTTTTNLLGEKRVHQSSTQRCEIWDKFPVKQKLKDMNVSLHLPQIKLKAIGS